MINNDPKNHLDGLNEAQREAVQHITGPLLVLAGAGSGKTRVITHRIVQIILEGTSPRNILAVTFTNKAAGEMRERVLDLMKQFPATATSVDTPPTVTTFHSLGVRLLREFHATINLRRHFTIFDRQDSLKAVKMALEQTGYNPKEYEPKKILSAISKAKGDAISVTDYTAKVKNPTMEVNALIWRRYEQILHEEQALDFDDLLIKTLNLLKNYPEVRKTLQNRYHYIHVDEYQDTNEVQFEIVRILAAKHNNLCVVGDIDQNIYSWRGANIKNILQFEKLFPGAAIIRLEENYRSTKTIIAVSNEIIAKNQNRIPKEVFTNNQEGDKLDLYIAMNGQDEAEQVLTNIQALLQDGVDPGEIAILYRTNFLSRGLEEVLMRAGINYQLLGTKFYDRKEIKDVLSYLRLALNPDSRTDLSRVINEPARGIGKVTLLKILENRQADISGATLAKVQSFYRIIEDISQVAVNKPLSETIKFIITRSGIEDYYTQKGTEDDLSKLENLRELVSTATHFDHLPPEEAVEALLETAALQSDQDELTTEPNQATTSAVRLMTVHAAKGLEFPYVFIIGLEEGLFPHERLDESKTDNEEERRLFYVALTRAEKKIFLSYAQIRTIFGSQRINIPSSFLNDIASEHLEITNPDEGGYSSGHETTIYLD